MIRNYTYTYRCRSSCCWTIPTGRTFRNPVFAGKAVDRPFSTLSISLWFKCNSRAPASLVCAAAELQKFASFVGLRCLCIKKASLGTTSFISRGLKLLLFFFLRDRLARSLFSLFTYHRIAVLSCGILCGAIGCPFAAFPPRSPPACATPPPYPTAL